MPWCLAREVRSTARNRQAARTSAIGMRLCTGLLCFTRVHVLHDRTMPRCLAGEVRSTARNRQAARASALSMLSGTGVVGRMFLDALHRTIASEKLLAASIATATVLLLLLSTMPALMADRCTPRLGMLLDTLLRAIAFKKRLALRLDAAQLGQLPRSTANAARLLAPPCHRCEEARCGYDQRKPACMSHPPPT